MRKNACVVAVGLVATAMFGADIYPNAHLVARHVGADTNETVSAAVNDGTLWKNGSGTTTFSAPSFSSLSEVKVQNGGVVLAMDDVPTVPALPAALADEVALWLDSTTNVVTSADGNFVEKWYDRREADVTAATLVRPYVESGNTRNGLAESVYAVERRPDFLASVAELANRPAVYFGTYGTAGARWMHTMNTGDNASWQYLRVREVFAVCARDDSDGNGHLLMLGSGATTAGKPAWTAAKDYVWGDTQNVRAHFSSFRFDRSPESASRFPVLDTGWHLISATIPMEDAECAINQIGLDRIYPSGSGGFKLAELVVFRKRLTAFDRMRVEDYLWKKWMGAKQTAFGTLNVASNAVAEVRSASNVRGALAGSGRFVQNGTGLATVVDDRFGGEIELKQGSVRTGNGRFVLAEGGQTLAAGRSGVVTRSGGDSATAVEKTGTGSMTVGAISNAVSTLKVSGGEVRLAPKADDCERLPAMPSFPNADFEAFNLARGGSQNVGGGQAIQAYTNQNWIFNRMERAGGALVLIINQYNTTYYSSVENADKTDATGIGWNGGTLAYICRGSATGMFTLPEPGMYRLQMTVSVRPGYENKQMRILVDGVECCGYLTSFALLENMRFEVALPWLAAGYHEVAIADIDPADSKVLLFDDLKILPARSLAEAPVKVEIANPGFELPAGRTSAAKPSLAALEGWTVPAESSDGFNSGQNTRRWHSWLDSKNDNYNAGLFCVPEEMAEGFLCAQLLGTNSFSQSVSFPSAGRYRLSFALAKRPMNVVQTVVVSVGGKVVKMIVVPHIEFRRYEVEFDVDAEGPQLLEFKGLVCRYWYRDFLGRDASNVLNLYMDAAAYLDDIACERVGDIPAANLLADGGFEGEGAEWTRRGMIDSAMGGAYGDGVWEYNRANSLGRGNSWPYSHTRAPIGGTNAVVLGGAKLGNGALRQVVELEAGRYELSFSREAAFADKDQTDQRTDFWVAVSPGYEYNYNYIYCEYPQETEMAARKTVAFTVPTNGSYMIEFHTVFDQDVSLMLDDVCLRRADVASVASYADSIPEKLQIEVASGARLNLDFDGTAYVKRVTYAGRSYAGVISHQTHPEFVMGRGELYAIPQGTVILFR